MKRPVKNTQQIIGLGLVSVMLALTTGCVNPDGSPNNTATGALIGGAMGAFVGAASSGRHGGQNALIGALVGAAAGGLVGHLMDEQQQERLRQQSPQTLQTVQHNEALASQPAPPPAAPDQPAPPAEAPTPLKVDDIKALTAAGVKPDAIIQAIKESRASAYGPSDIQAAQQASPPVDPSVIAYMQNPAA
jgi:predicted lipid-binding transport protein (Tim44 family)